MEMSWLSGLTCFNRKADQQKQNFDPNARPLPLSQCPMEHNPVFVIGDESKDSGEPKTSRLFCFASAGGNATLFKDFHFNCGNTVQVVAVALPGRAPNSNGEPHTSMATLVKFIAFQIAQYCDLPFSFFGHSLGACVAFEVACAFKLYGWKTPDKLFCSAMEPPHCHPFLTTPPSEKVSTKSYKSLVEYLRREGGTPAEVLDNPELMNIFIPSIRADYKVIEEYEFKLDYKTDADIIVCYGDKDIEVKKLVAWEEVTEGNFEMQGFSGGHFYIHEDKSLFQFLQLHMEGLRKKKLARKTGEAAGCLLVVPCLSPQPKH